jgi:hypothetical protein
VALRYDLLVEQGADYERLFPVFDGNGAPANVDGWTVTGQIRGSYGDTTVLHTLTLVPTGTNVRSDHPRRHLRGLGVAASPIRYRVDRAEHHRHPAR